MGSRLLPLLVSAGHEVIGMTRGATKSPLIRSLGARPVIANAFDRSSVFSAVIGERPDIMIHEMTDLSNRNFDANTRLRIEGTRNLVDAAASAGVRRIIAQSIAWAYAPGSGKAIEEESLDLGAPGERRRMVEGISALEQAVLDVEFGVVLRYGTLYGPGTGFAKDGWFSQEVLQGKALATTAMTSFLHIDDAAYSALLALDWPRGPVNIVDDDPTPGTIWLPIYAAAIGAPSPETGPDDSMTTRGASNDKARHRLGWQPIHPTWRDGLLNALE